MKYFSIQCTTVNNVAVQEKQMAAQLQAIASSVSSTLGQISGSSALKSDMRSALRSAADSISDQQSTMERLSAVLSESVAEYEATEKSSIVVQIDPYLNQSMTEAFIYTTNIAGGVLGSFIGDTGSQILFWGNSQKPSAEYEIAANYEYDRDWTLEKATALKQKIKEWDDKQKKWGYETKDGVFVKKEEKEKEDIEVNAGTIVKGMTLYSKNFSDTDSLVSGDEPWLSGEVTGKFGKMGGSIEALTLDRYAGFNIGAGGISGAAGYKFSALSASGETQLGNDTLGIHLRGEVDVLTGGISGKGAVSYLNDKGEFDPNVHVGAEAGVYLATASVTGGVDVLGTDVDATLSGEVGVGVHAEFGYEDGKFKVDVGAALGVGVSIDLEIDISEPVEQVAEWIGDTYSAWFS